MAIFKEAELAIEDGKTEIAKIRSALENKFDNVMQQARLWYKRKAYFYSLLIGLLLAFGLNIDAIGITRTLWENPALREQVVLTAEYYTQQEEEEQQVKALDEYKKLESIGFPIGWSFKSDDKNTETPYNVQDFPIDFWGWLLKALGIVITGLAVAQGSPFWFDLLNKLVNLRTTTKPDEEKKNEHK